jgi:hypothetical protein
MSYVKNSNDLFLNGCSASFIYSNNQQKGARNKAPFPYYFDENK